MPQLSQLLSRPAGKILRADWQAVHGWTGIADSFGVDFQNSRMITGIGALISTGGLPAKKVGAGQRASLRTTTDKGVACRQM